MVTDLQEVGKTFVKDEIIISASVLFVLKKY